MRRCITGVGLALTLLFCACGSGGSGGTAQAPGASSPPLLDSPQPATVSPTQAVISASVNPNGNATEAWFEFGTDPGLAAPLQTVRQAIGSGSAPVTVNATIVNLAASTTYYYRVAASNSAGTQKGAVANCTTLPSVSAPTVRTATTASGVGADNAGLSGIVNPNSNASEAWFEWGTDSQLSAFVATPHQAIGSGISDVAVTGALTGLASNRTYYFRMAGANSLGTSKGTISAFTTAAAAQRVCTDCHGGVNGDNTQVRNNAPNITKYWLSSGHGRFSTKAPQSVHAILCDDCHDLNFLSAADHKTDGTAGAADPPANINTLMWPGKTGTVNTVPDANTSHLKASFFPVSPVRKSDYALAFDTQCGSLTRGCHTLRYPLSHVGYAHPDSRVDNVLTFGRTHANTPPDPKIYSWYPTVVGAADYANRSYESPAVWLVSDLTTLADNASYPDASVSYGGCISCHDPHGTGVPIDVSWTSNKMLRGVALGAAVGPFCNLACHGN